MFLNQFLTLDQQALLSFTLLVVVIFLGYVAFWKDSGRKGQSQGGESF
jgi:hypothetical protein